MTTVIVAEKPSVALDIGRVVGATLHRDGYVESGDRACRVTWALGHLVELAAPEEIRPEWRRWSALPILPERFPLVPRRESAARAQLTVIARLLKSSSTKLIVNAADAGREGELVFRYILEWVFGERGSDKPIKRFWASSLTDEAIRQALAAMRSSASYDRLAAAARLRSRLDWLVGMNGTRALRAFGGRAGLSMEQRKTLTVGRVQTPTLAMIARLDETIRTFEPKPYREVQASFLCDVSPQREDGTARPEPSARVTATYIRLSPDERGVQKWDARLWPSAGGEPLSPIENPAQVCRRARTGKSALASVQRETRVTRPPLLFDLTSLQREANVLWGWAASKTLTIAQELYEKHKLLSYPRTDTRHLSSTVAAQLPSIVAVIREPYADQLVAETGQTELGTRFVDDSQVGDHHAIIPTSRVPGPQLAKGSDAHRLVDLVCRRLLSAWQPDCIEQRRELVFEVANDGITDRYVARSTDIVQSGWRALDPRFPVSESSSGPELRAGTATRLADVTVLDKATQAPKHFTEATLLGAMETAGRTLHGKAGAALRDRGLGTAATRASIIEGLIARGYVAREGRTLGTTPLGARLVANVAEALTSAELTGDMEARLRLVERGAESADSVAEDVRAFVEALVEAHRPKVGR